MKNFLRCISFVLLFCIALLSISCKQSTTTVTGNIGTGESGSDATTIVPTEETDVFTDRDADTSYSEDDALSLVLVDDATFSEDERIQIDGNVVTLTGAGTYLISGSLTRGQIRINASDSDKLHLILDGVSINSAGSAALYILNADKVFITLASDTINTLSSTGTYLTDENTNADAALYSKKDVSINGNGTLHISSEAGHGVAVKADLVMMDGNYTVSGAKHALSAKNSIRIKSGTYTLNAGTDGLHAENADKTEKGFIYIFGGTFMITAASDGIDAASTLQIIDGTFTVQAEGKGVKSTGDLLIAGGTLQITSTDDSLHTNASCAITGGSLTLSTSDDGVHADANLTVHDGTIDILKSYEGLEGKSVDIAGGTICIVASDDGVNTAGGSDQSGFQPGFTGGKNDTFQSDATCYIQISGGNLTVNAGGDGLDSNGNITVTGGVTYVSGSTNSADSALDYDGTGTITGGVIILTGNSGMAQNFGTASTQGSILLNFSSTSTAPVTLADSDGNTILTYQPPKTYNSVVVSAPSLTKGNTYSLSACGQTQNITLSSLIYGSGSMGGGGMGGGSQPGGRPGGRP